MAFDFQNLDIYKKAKAFHLDCRALMAANKLDNYVRDQLARAWQLLILNPKLK